MKGNLFSRRTFFWKIKWIISINSKSSYFNRNIESNYLSSRKRFLQCFTCSKNSFLIEVKCTIYNGKLDKFLPWIEFKHWNLNKIMLDAKRRCCSHSMCKLWRERGKKVAQKQINGAWNMWNGTNSLQITLRFMQVDSWFYVDFTENS